MKKQNRKIKINCKFFSSIKTVGEKRNVDNGKMSRQNKHENPVRRTCGEIRLDVEERPLYRRLNPDCVNFSYRMKGNSNKRCKFVLSFFNDP